MEKKIQSISNARIPDKLGQRTLATVMMIATIAFAAPIYSQTVATAETNSVNSFRGETITKQNESKMKQTTKEQSAASAEDTSIRPFQFHATDEELADLRRRILATRWPDQEIVKDQSQGVQLATMKALAKYWATDYDWRKAEARLN